MTDTTSIHPNVPRQAVSDWRARLSLVAGLIIVPVAVGLFGFLCDERRNPSLTTRHLGGILMLVLWLGGFCSCVASAFLSLYPLPRKFVLAFVAVGLFALDTWLSFIACECVFDLN